MVTLCIHLFVSPPSLRRNRKKIAKYKAVAALLQKKDCEELQVISVEDTSAPASPLAKPPNGELSEDRPGDILLTYKDGNTSSLYPDPPPATVTAQEEEEEVTLAEEDRQVEDVKKDEEEEQVRSNMQLQTHEEDEVVKAEE